MDKLLTAEEMAPRLGIKAETLMAWAREGKVPSVKATARVIRFDPDDVIAALKARAGDDK